MRAAAAAAAIVGGIGSVAMTVYAGRHNPSALLVLAFAIWVLSPFVPILWATAASRRWPAAAQTLLCAVSLVVAIACLSLYGLRLARPPKAQAAFIFVILPPACWLFIALAAALMYLRHRGDARL